MPNLVLNPPAATFLHDVQVNLTGSGDNIPNTDELWIVITDVSGSYFGTGDDEFCFGPLPAVTGNNTVGQQVQNVFCNCGAPGLQPSTQYFARVERHTAGNNPGSAAAIEVSPQITFTTAPAADPNYWNNTCDSPQQGDPGLQRNELFMTDPGMDDGWACGINDTYVEIGPSNAGPWSPATNFFGNPHTSLLSGDQNAGISNPITEIPGCAPVFIRYTLYQDGFVYGSHIEEQICGPFTPFCHPQLCCPLSTGQNQIDCGNTQVQSSGSRTEWQIAVIADPGIASFNFGGGLDNDPLNQDLFRVRYGTTPGGPYPNALDFPVTQPSFVIGSIPGLQPSTTYYYLIELYEQNNVDNEPQTLYASAGECSFTTLSYGPECATATNVTPNSAQLNGTVDQLETNRFARFIWGTTPGGPYPNVTPNIPGSQASDQFLTANIGPLPTNTTFYYKVQVLDTDGVTVLEEQSIPECSFVTQGFDPECLPATNITTDEADLHGIADNVPTNRYLNIVFDPAPGPPLGLTGSSIPGDNTLDQNIDTHLSGLTPGTTYVYAVVITDSTDSQIFELSSVCQFTTANLPDVSTDPPTNIGPDCVTLNGTGTDVPAGCQYVFDYGSSPGNYDHTVGASVPPGGTSTGASPEPFSAQVCGLMPNQTLYYRSRLICNNQTAAVGDPEQVATSGDGVYYCGMLFDINDCVFVDMGNGDGYYYCFCEVNELFNLLAADDRPDTGAGDC